MSDGTINIDIKVNDSDLVSKTKAAATKAGAAAGNALESGINKGATSGSAKAEGAVASFGSRIKSAMGTIGSESGTGFMSSISGRLSGLGSSVSSKASSAVSGVKGIFASGGGNSGASFLSNVTTKLSGLGSSITGKASSALSSVKSRFSTTGEQAGSEMGSRIASSFAAKAGAIGGVAATVAQSALGVITSAIDSAVSRVDTLNNFPTVLTNLGYSADDAAASTQTLSDRLSQLPTKLNDAASGVQQLAPASASVQQATDRYLAFNDALLAGAASEQVQENAMQQLTKSLNTGKMEMDSWMSIQEAMPGQLTQVAKAMLGADASASDLYNGMKDGTISVQDFADAMVNLDQNGAEGIASFSQQAETAVGGIATTLSNTKNAVVKGVASIIEAIGTENIVGALNVIKGGINAAFSGIVSLVEPAKQAISDFGNSLTSIDASSGVFTAFMAQASALLPVVSSALSMVVNGALAVLPGILESLAPLATALLALITAAVPIIAQMVADVINFAAQLIAAVAPAITSIVAVITAALPLIQAIWNAVFPLLASVVSTVFGIISTVISTVMGVIQGIIQVVTSAISGNWSGVWEGIQQIASSIWSGIQSLVSGAINAVKSVISSVLNAISGAWSSAWSSVASFLSSAWSNMTSAASSGVSAVYNAVVGIKDRIVGFFSGAGSWLISSGRAMLDGLKQGIQNGISGAINAVKNGISEIRSFFPFSPAKKGPFSGHGYTTYSGKALMGDFAASIKQAGIKAKATVAETIADIQGTFGVPIGGVSLDVADSLSAGVSTVQVQAQQAQAASTTVNQTVNFNQPMNSPDQVARTMRLQQRYGLAGSYV